MTDPQQPTSAPATSAPDKSRRQADRGSSTVEYALVVLVAAAFAGMLLTVVRSDSIRGLLAGMIERALS